MIGMTPFREPPRQSARQRQGQHFEQMALAYLRQQGLTLVAQNFCCRVGELDLVMRGREHLVFVEVRYRQRAEFGSALASVVRRKQLRVIHAAQYFLQRHPRYAELPCRFDVVALSPDASHGTRIEWISNAFE
jgi:putative endonuclease